MGPPNFTVRAMFAAVDIVCAREVLRAIHGCGSDNHHDSRGASIVSYCTSRCFLAAKIARSRTSYSNKVSSLLGLALEHIIASLPCRTCCCNKALRCRRKRAVFLSVL